MNTREKNYYQILEIPSKATGDEIYRGYIQAKNAYSQDSVALYSLLSKKECDEILEVIEEAYTILSNPEKRAQYDLARGINKSPLEDVDEYRDEERQLAGSAKAIKMNEKVSSSGPMTKIVAQKRFSLDYTPDPKFEKEIEGSNDFPGSFLKKIREYKNVDIPRMADMTKVSKTYLRNIEKDDYKNLPALVYVRGFVYQYAKCLKLNPVSVAASYIRHLNTVKDKEKNKKPL